MARSRSRGGRGPALLGFRTHVAAVLVLLLPLSSCALSTQGRTHVVPVDTRPARAEVFVDGVSVGVTPLELTLARGRDHVVEVRLGGQQRSFTVKSEVQAGMVALDLVPVGVAAGLGLVVASLPDGFGWLFAPVVLAVVGVSVVPILVDFGSGAIYRLDPGELIVVFE